MILNYETNDYGYIESEQFNSIFQYHDNNIYGYYKDENYGFEPVIFIFENHDFIYNLIISQIKQNTEDWIEFEENHHIVLIYTDPHIINIKLDNDKYIKIILTYDLKYWEHINRLLTDIPYRVEVDSRFGVDTLPMLNKPIYEEWGVKNGIKR